LRLAPIATLFPYTTLFRSLRYLDDRIQKLDEQIRESVQRDPIAKRLMTLRGVGPLIASALAGALGDGKAFKKGRDFAASLGLTPDRKSTRLNSSHVKISYA